MHEPALSLFLENKVQVYKDESQSLNLLASHMQSHLFQVQELHTLHKQKSPAPQSKTLYLIVTKIHAFSESSFEFYNRIVLWFHKVQFVNVNYLRQHWHGYNRGISGVPLPYKSILSDENNLLFSVLAEKLQRLFLIKNHYNFLFGLQYSRDCICRSLLKEFFDLFDHFVPEWQHCNLLHLLFWQQWRQVSQKHRRQLLQYDIVSALVF